GDQGSDNQLRAGVRHHRLGRSRRGGTAADRRPRRGLWLPVGLRLRPAQQGQGGRARRHGRRNAVLAETKRPAWTDAGRQRDPQARRSMMQDDPRYHSPQSYVYVDGHAFTLDELWSGVDRLERLGVSLAAIGRALSQDWETSVIALARVGRRRL